MFIFFHILSVVFIFIVFSCDYGYCDFNVVTDHRFFLLMTFLNIIFVIDVL